MFPSDFPAFLDEVHAADRPILANLEWLIEDSQSSSHPNAYGNATSTRSAGFARPANPSETACVLGATPLLKPEISTWQRPVPPCPIAQTIDDPAIDRVFWLGRGFGRLFDDLPGANEASVISDDSSSMAGDGVPK